MLPIRIKIIQGVFIGSDVATSSISLKNNQMTETCSNLDVTK